MNKKLKIITLNVAILGILVVGYFYLNHILFDGVKPRYISENGFRGTLFANKDTENRPTIILIGGGH